MPGLKRQHGLACCLALLALLGAGCGTRSEDDVAGVRESGQRLSRAPEPLRMAEVRREPTGPRQAVMRLLYWAQWGSVPNIVDSYDPAVRRRVGASNIVGTYSQARSSLAASRPRIQETTQSPVGTVVTVELLSATSPPALHSFLLRRRDDRWRVVFDTLLETGLESYVRAQPDRRSVARGQAAARRYRDLFASRLGR